ncbi:SDR family oxidoreductase [Nocardioides campestrisoli]|uniref:SDR family oxidoreductase n=1 Tax=Nocardioides campestrisoli TaxID=2736757 RepID=UPI001C637337|nr:SDR family oxidoreductase [Nocardioides campestrisoli]
MTVRTHLLTGGGSGIGRALAQRLHARGDRLVLLARSPERAAELGAELPGSTCLVVDLADPAAVTAAGPELAGLGPLDSVVHCAGVVELARVSELDDRAWAEQLQVNLTAPVMLTRALLPALRATRGTVVLVSSTAVRSGNPRWSAYAAAKAGLGSFAEALRAEEAEHGVRVSTVYPSRTATPMQELVHDQEGRPYDASAFLRPESVAASLCHVLDLPADATVTDLTVRTAPSPTTA